MDNNKKIAPPAEVINEDSGPMEIKNPEGEGIDVDDALIQEPKDDAFKTIPKSEKLPKQQRPNT